MGRGLLEGVASDSHLAYPRKGAPQMDLAPVGREHADRAHFPGASEASPHGENLGGISNPNQRLLSPSYRHLLKFKSEVAKADC
jgi:hypothetical protein